MIIRSFTEALYHTGFSFLYGRIWRAKYMKVVKQISVVLFVFIILPGGNSYSQTAYRTTNGFVLVAGIYNDSAFFTESHKLVFDYNPANKTIYGSLNLQTFTSGINFIDSILTAKNRLITFNGYIPVDFLTWDHLEYNLDVPLEIKLNNTHINTLSKMKFSHVDKLLNYTCILEASFNLKLSDFDINVPEAVGSDVSVQFLQLILRRGRK